MGSSKNRTIKNNFTDQKAMELLEAIRMSEEYKEYIYFNEELKKDPELYERVCDYRKRNFRLQNMDVNDNMFDEVMRFQIENVDIRKNGLVNSFLKAELSVCRMLQDIFNDILDGIDIDLSFLRD